jgi:hypothetical protein
MLPDTVITDEQSVRLNALPGRLKSVILNGRLAVGYAGAADQAIDAIRRLSTEPNPVTK